MTRYLSPEGTAAKSPSETSSYVLSLIQLAGVLREKRHEVILIDVNGESISYEEIEKRPLFLQAIDAGVFRFTPTTFDHEVIF